MPRKRKNEPKNEAPSAPVETQAEPAPECPPLRPETLGLLEWLVEEALDDWERKNAGGAGKSKR